MLDETINQIYFFGGALISTHIFCMIFISVKIKSCEEKIQDMIKTLKEN